MIVWGLIAFDNAIAILETFFDLFRVVPSWPSPILLVRALMLPAAAYDEDQILGLTQAALRLKSKSRSFYLASSFFQGRLRIDLTILYSFCRVADDLIDNAKSASEAKDAIRKLNDFLDLSYQRMTRPARMAALQEFIEASFPFNAQLALFQLPTYYLPKAPLYDLIRGFETDLKFAGKSTSDSQAFPIANEKDLDTYSYRVAGTVAELCLALVFHHYPNTISKDARERIVHAGRQMGLALQCTNISRDIGVDAGLKRVYIPTAWLEEEDLTPDAVIKNPQGTRVEKLRQRMLNKAFATYEEAKGAIDELPVETRAPMRVAVESYMEIARILKTDGYKVKAGRATVPLRRRLWVAWKALSRG
jgi:15-cis-phytoene synthase / lycopene beta-cyclase